MRKNSPSELHPCFTCPLPDCDDKSPGCALRKARNVYRSMVKQKAAIPDEVRQRYNHAYRELYGADRRRRASAEYPVAP